MQPSWPTVQPKERLAVASTSVQLSSALKFTLGLLQSQLCLSLLRLNIPSISSIPSIPLFSPRFFSPLFPSNFPYLFV